MILSQYSSYHCLNDSLSVTNFCKYMKSEDTKNEMIKDMYNGFINNKAKNYTGQYTYYQLFLDIEVDNPVYGEYNILYDVYLSYHEATNLFSIEVEEKSQHNKVVFERKIKDFPSEETFTENVEEALNFVLDKLDK